MSKPVCARRAPYAVGQEVGDWQAQASRLRRLQLWFRFDASALGAAL